MLKAILFDIDGTLVRTGGAGVKAFAETFKSEFGFADGSERLKFAGRTDVSLVREFFSHHKVEPTPDHFARFFWHYQRLLEQIIVGCDGAICPGVTPLLDGLENSGKPMAIGLLTGNVREGARIKLAHYNLWHRFSFGGFADDDEDRDKIAAVALERARVTLGVSIQPDEALVIGDTPLDIRCARAIGAKVLAVATGAFSVADLEQHAPDWAVADLGQVHASTLAGRFG